MLPTLLLPVGASVFVGFAIMLVMLPVQYYTSHLYEKLQLQQMKYKDMRVNMMNEILGGIKASRDWVDLSLVSILVRPGDKVSELSDVILHQYV